MENVLKSVYLEIVKIGANVNTDGKDYDAIRTPMTVLGWKTAADPVSIDV